MHPKYLKELFEKCDRKISGKTVSSLGSHECFVVGHCHCFKGFIKSF